MRVAAIYDIHANLPALEAVLREIRQAGADRVVIGGDVLPGPMPRETLARLAGLGIPSQCIHGNGEVAVLEEMAGKKAVSVPEPYRPIIRWTAQQLDADHQRLLSTWPKTLRLEIGGLGQVLFCHATPRNENEIFTQRTPEERLLPIFQGLGVSTVVCGHTHMQFDRIIGTTRVLNAGSVGMPFGKPGAYWLLLGPHVQFRHTLYDFANVADCIRATNYPEAGNFAAHNILQPPSEGEMLEAFTRAGLR
jgi:predicted phosphodiesterase